MLYLSHHPHHHLLPFFARFSTGLKKTNLYYIQDGKINDYALGFQVPVAPNISALHFTWQNKDPRIEVHNRTHNYLFTNQLNLDIVSGMDAD